MDKNIFKVNGKFNLGTLIISILLAQGIGVLSAAFTMGSGNLYTQLERPIFSPPPIVFSIVWPILYLLMGIAAYRIYMRKKDGENVKKALVLYAIQLVLNFMWSIIFFRFKLYGLAFIELIILLIFIILTTIEFFKKDRIAGFLMLPYVIWVSFAAILNFYIWKFNEM